MFGECRSDHLQRGNKMDIVLGSMGLFERERIQYPRHLCGNNLDPMHIYNYTYTYTYTSIWVAPLFDDLFPYGVGLLHHDGWIAGRVNRLHDHVNVPCPAASPPNREEPGIHGHFYAKGGNGYPTPPFFYIPPSGEESRPEKTIRAHGLIVTINLQRSETPRCHPTPRGYFPDVSLLRGGGGEKGLRESHRPPASESAGKSERTRQSGAAATALTDTMGAYHFWRYAKVSLTC
ncbi:hypothetical protein EDB83DRAFT_1807497 [Lactarius deliciosus]|nr:hypothetical protein EDB83DRAFT_1807497 [Lactarius deliciosus]